MRCFSSRSPNTKRVSTPGCVAAAALSNRIGGGLNRSAQHSNLLAEMECEHEAATSHLLFCGSAV
jgi:hypothetical protein